MDPIGIAPDGVAYPIEQVFDEKRGQVLLAAKDKARSELAVLGDEVVNQANRIVDFAGAVNGWLPIDAYAPPVDTATIKRFGRGSAVEIVTGNVGGELFLMPVAEFNRGTGNSIKGIVDPTGHFYSVVEVGGVVTSVAIKSYPDKDHNQYPLVPGIENVDLGQGKVTLGVGEAVDLPSHKSVRLTTEVVRTDAGAVNLDGKAVDSIKTTADIAGGKLATISKGLADTLASAGHLINK